MNWGVGNEASVEKLSSLGPVQQEKARITEVRRCCGLHFHATLIRQHPVTPQARSTGRHDRGSQSINVFSDIGDRKFPTNSNRILR